MTSINFWKHIHYPSVKIYVNLSLKSIPLDEAYFFDEP